MSNRGFTLVEILVTIVLLSVGIVALLKMMSAGMLAGANSENYTTALYLAQEELENIKDAETYAAVNDFASARASLSGDFTAFDREVTVSGDPKRVDVTVYWDSVGGDQSLTLTTLFADYDY